MNCAVTEVENSTYSHFHCLEVPPYALCYTLLRHLHISVENEPGNFLSANHVRPSCARQVVEERCEARSVLRCEKRHVPLVLFRNFGRQRPSQEVIPFFPWRERPVRSVSDRLRIRNRGHNCVLTENYPVIRDTDTALYAKVPPSR